MRAAILVGFLLFLFIPLPQAEISDRNKDVSPTEQERASIGLPVRLKIPVIGVDAVVMPVGLTNDGMMDAPKDPKNVGWLTAGTVPGKKGSAVIAGHFGLKNSVPAAFDRLHALRQGDVLTIENEDGITITFVVRKVQIYNQHEDTSGVFGSTDDGIHLNLITCDGVWDTDLKSYSNRLVIFTDKE